LFRSFPAVVGAQPGEERVQALLGTVLTPEPDSATAFEVADHDAVLVPLADGHLVDAEDAGRRVARVTELFPHVLLVQLLDGVPVEEQFLRHLLPRRLPAPGADEQGKPIGLRRLAGEPVEALALHAAAAGALDPAQVEHEVHPFVATRQIADTPRPLVVVAGVDRPADSAA